MTEPVADEQLMQPAVLAEASSGIVTVTMNRPDQRNRLDVGAMTLLRDHLRAAGVDPSVRAVVLTGSGSTFCSGADLAAAGLGTVGAGLLVEVLNSILDCPVPVIAKVGGHVAGGGNGLVAACDLAVASEGARFAFSEVRVGVAPAIISVVCLAVMNRRDAQELLLGGERVDAHRALRAGLLTAVAPGEGLDDLVAGYVEQLMAGGPGAVRRTKELLRRVPRMPMEEAFAWTAQVSAEAFGSAEAHEGMSAFLAKRPAAWIPPDA
jgi:methylglutaconyl-CoA hydratase